MFRSEVRFYREVAPEVGVRVPACFEADITDDGTRLVLEDLSAWDTGADPLGVARQLRRLHERWAGVAIARWPWLRGPGAAADLIGAHYDAVWPRISQRTDLPDRVRHLGQSLVGQVALAEHAEGQAGPLTLCHGDTSSANLATGPDGEIAFLDWEDVRYASGVTDLAWFLVSSVDPEQWAEVEAAYDGPPIEPLLRSATAQGLFSLESLPDGDPQAAQWMRRLEAAAVRLGL